MHWKWSNYNPSATISFKLTNSLLWKMMILKWTDWLWITSQQQVCKKLKEIKKKIATAQKSILKMKIRKITVNQFEQLKVVGFMLLFLQS